MNELYIKGRKYISSKRAAEISGYAKDYIGQLVRMGKLPAERAGRAWFVDEKALLEHAGFSVNQSDGNVSTITASSELVSRKEEAQLLASIHHKDFLSRSPTWENIVYLPDTDPLIPPLMVQSKNTHEISSYSGTEPTVEIKKVTEDTKADDIKEKKAETTEKEGGIIKVHIKSSQNNMISQKQERKILIDGIEIKEKISAHTHQSRVPIKKYHLRGLAVSLVGLIFFLLAITGIFVPLSINIGDQNVASAYDSTKYATELLSFIFRF